MTAKRALVVDDSKSARAFLAKLLEEQSVEVDAAETAEQAIEYLAHHRPDVIFMDHLMPGMDGFQAVQAIKSNPRTAMIPILMYTSQEGELYLGQARALGAVGVLPKSVAPVDVRTVLQQLHLMDQPEAETVAAQPELLDAAEAVAATVEMESPTNLLSVPRVTEELRDEIATLRRHMADQIEHLGQRFSNELRAAVRDALPIVAEPRPLQEPERASPAPWILALVAGLAAVVMGTLWWQARASEQSLRNELADAHATVTEMSARLTSAPAAAPLVADATPGQSAGGAAAPAVVVKVPFGEAPLAGTRIDKLREVVSRQIAQNARGTVEVRRYAGRFCLSGGGGSDGYSLAESSLPYIKCELVADATDPQLHIGPAESVAFANVLAELRKQAGDAILIDVQEGRAENTVMAYPEIGGTPPRVPTAGEYNAAAEANNRVEIRWHPAP
ncbi:MAG TPA: response regulator [Steroidobacteraceae bacterium]|nr:response regulator [Steroidobacteraceae bacterium]